jgi:hypothetical protein
MARKVKLPADSPAFWPLEAEPSELEEYVSSRVRGPYPIPLWTDDVPVEPGWVREAMEASWPRVLAEADALHVVG